MLDSFAIVILTSSAIVILTSSAIVIPAQAGIHEHAGFPIKAFENEGWLTREYKRPSERAPGCQSTRWHIALMRHGLKNLK